MRARHLAVLLALAVPALCTDLSVGAGACLTLAKPVSNLDGGPWVKGRTGEGIGLRVPLRFASNQAIVPRLDFRDLGTGPMDVLASDKTTHLYTERAKAQFLDLGVDYQYYLRRWDDVGSYFSAGLAYSQVRIKDGILEEGGFPLPAGTVWAAAQTKRVPQWAVGAGYKFRPWAALEFRFTQSLLKDVGVPHTLMMAPVFNLSLVLDF